MECFERFLDRSSVVPSMDLVEIDIIGAKPAQAGVNLLHDRASRQACAVWAGTHTAVNLGRDDDVRAAGIFLQSATEHLLARATGVDIRSVKEIYTAFQGPLDERTALRVVEAPGVVF